MHQHNKQFIISKREILPSNDELKSGIKEIQQEISENKQQLSKQGRLVASDTNHILETTKELIDEKNDGELVQEIYRQVYKATDKETLEERRNKLKNIIFEATDPNSENRDEISESAQHITKIMKLLVTSREFRRLINDLESIFEQVFVVDEDKDKSTKIDEKSSSGNDVSMEAVSPARMGGMNPTHFYFNDEADKSGYTPFQITSASNQVPFGESKISVGDEIEMGNETKSKSKDEGSEEVEETLIEYWAKITKTLHENPEYRESINYLLDSIQDLSEYISKKAEEMEDIQLSEGNKKENQQADKHMEKAWSNAKKFLENWIAHGYSLDKFLNSVHDLAMKAKDDKDLEEYFSQLKNFFFKSVADSDYVKNEEKVKEDARERIIRGRRLMRGKYQKEFERLHKEIEYLNDGIQNDSGVIQLQNDFEKLVRDLFVDENGNAKIHSELLHDLQVIVPALVKKLRRLPLPDIDLCDEESDLKIRNAVLDCGDIAPSYFRFTLQGDVEGSLVRNYIQVIVSKIRAKIIGADFYYNKKTFPKITESGRADLSIYGKNGMTIGFEICPYDNHGESKLILRRNLCKISQLNLRLRNTDHDILYGMLSPIINAVVKTRIENIIKETLKDIIEHRALDAKRYVEQGIQGVSEVTKETAQKASEMVEESTSSN